MEKISFNFENENSEAKIVSDLDNNQESFVNGNKENDRKGEEEKPQETQEKKQERISRRDFLKTLGVGAAVAAAELAELKVEAEAKNKKENKKHKNYSKGKIADKQEKKEFHNESAVNKIKRELFEKKEIVLPSGEKFRNRADAWEKRYAGEDSEFDRFDLMYKRKHGLPLKTIYQELKEGWERLINNGELSAVREITKSESVPFSLIFLALAESHWKAKAKSRVGAAGPWQFMPGTAREYGLKVNKFKDERLDARKSTTAACRFLKKLHSKTYEQGVKNISASNRWIWSFWAYNHGPGRIFNNKKRKQKGHLASVKGDPNKYNQVCGNKESRDYAPKILGLSEALEKIAYGKIQVKEPARETGGKISPADQMFESYFDANFSSASEKIKFLERVIDKYEDEEQRNIHSGDYIEDAIDVVYKEIEEIKKSLPKPKKEKEKSKVKLRVVEGEGEHKIIKLKKKKIFGGFEDEDELPTVVYEVRHGDNLSKIAVWLSPSPDKIEEVKRLIRELNPKVRNWNLLRRGQSIVVPGEIIEVPPEKLSEILKHYYPKTDLDAAEKYLKWINGKNPDKEKIAPGEMILTPLSPEYLD